MPDSRRGCFAWVAERVAEQRLLWNLRREDRGAPGASEDMTSEQAVSLVKGMLRRDHDRHVIWLGVHGAASGCPASCLFVPGPERGGVTTSCSVPWGIWLSMRGAAPGTATASRGGQAQRGWRICVPVIERSAWAESVQKLDAIGADLGLPEAGDIRRAARGRSDILRTGNPHVNLRALAEQLGCRLEGDGDIEITGVAGIDVAEPGQVTFLANPKYQSAACSARARLPCCCVTTARLAPCAMLRPRIRISRSRAPWAVFAPEWRPAHRRARHGGGGDVGRLDGKACPSAPSWRSAMTRTRRRAYRHLSES
jgi:hypothetical protein